MYQNDKAGIWFSFHLRNNVFARDRVNIFKTKTTIHLVCIRTLVALEVKSEPLKIELTDTEKLKYFYVLCFLLIYSC